MYHQRTVAVAIFAHVFEAKAAGQIEIKLNCSELPRTSYRVDQLDVNFRAIKRRFALHALERHTQFGKRALERFGCTAPVLCRARVILRVRRIPIRKLYYIFAEAESLHHSECEIDACLDL